jgi:uncharacterized coiled-coil protein SlyX
MADQDSAITRLQEQITELKKAIESQQEVIRSLVKHVEELEGRAR